MARLTAEDLRLSTLSRQFPAISGTDEEAVLELLDHLGPIQSQVPRAPFLTISSRLPGVTYETVCRVFDTHRLLKTSSLRGTVHTSTGRNFGWLDGVAVQTRSPALRNALRLSVVSAADVNAEVRRFCAGEWRPRAEILTHVHDWLLTHESDSSAATLGTTYSDSIVWGNSGLLRGVPDGAWDKRNDNLHRTAVSVLPQLAPCSPDEALVRLVHDHLAAYGPVTRRDLAFFFGVGLSQVDAAVTALGDQVVRHTGPEDTPYLDLADPPVTAVTDPGLRLLPEFDGLLLGFAGPNRTRFVDAEGLSRIWAKVNGLFTPVVLYDGQLVATWKTRARGKRTDLEVTMLKPGVRLTEDLFADQITAVQAVLGLEVADIRVLAAG